MFGLVISEVLHEYWKFWRIVKIIFSSSINGICVFFFFFLLLFFCFCTQERHPVLRVLGVAQNVFDQLYYPLEHIAWACDAGLIKRPSAFYWVASIAAWGLSLCTSIVTILIKLHRLNLAIAGRYVMGVLRKRECQRVFYQCSQAAAPPPPPPRNAGLAISSRKLLRTKVHCCTTCLSTVHVWALYMFEHCTMYMFEHCTCLSTVHVWALYMFEHRTTTVLLIPRVSRYFRGTWTFAV